MPSRACHKAQLVFLRDLRVSVVSVFHKNRGKYPVGENPRPDYILQVDRMIRSKPKR